MGTDDAELFSLFSSHLSVHGSKDFFIGGVHAFGAKDRHIRNRFVGLFKNAGCNSRSGFAKDIGENIVQLYVGNS